MNKIIEQAIKKTESNMNKKRKKMVPMDLFPESGLFNGKNDPIAKLHSKIVSRPSIIKKWKESDFISYLSENIKNSLIRLTAYDKLQLQKLQDRITENLEVHKNDKDAKCDNPMLKTYLDWWMDTYKSHYFEQNTRVTIDFVCNEKNVREFFRSGAWMAPKTTQTLSGVSSRIKPPSQSYEEIYYRGGLGKLLYEAGVIESYYFLVNKEQKPSAVVARELRRALKSLHSAVFEHVIQKTFSKAPYSANKCFDVKKLLKPVFLKRNFTKFNDFRYEALFEQENLQ